MAAAASHSRPLGANRLPAIADSLAFAPAVRRFVSPSMHLAMPIKTIDVSLHKLGMLMSVLYRPRGAVSEYIYSTVGHHLTSSPI